MLPAVRRTGDRPSRLRHVIPAYVCIAVGAVVGVWKTNDLSEQRTEDLTQIVASLAATSSEACSEAATGRMGVRDLVTELVADSRPETRTRVLAILDRTLPPRDCVKEHQAAVETPKDD